jgi:hypothetical protein
MMMYLRVRDIKGKIRVYLSALSDGPCSDEDNVPSATLRHKTIGTAYDDKHIRAFLWSKVEEAH